MSYDIEDEHSLQSDIRRLKTIIERKKQELLETKRAYESECNKITELDMEEKKKHIHTSSDLEQCVCRSIESLNQLKFMEKKNR